MKAFVWTIGIVGLPWTVYWFAQVVAAVIERVAP